MHEARHNCCGCKVGEPPRQPPPEYWEDYCYDCWWKLEPLDKRAYLMEWRRIRAINNIAKAIDDAAKQGQEGEEWKGGLWDDNTR